MLRKLFFNLAYHRHPVWDTGTPPPELVDFIKSHSAGRALDMGCGTGTNVITLAKHSWHVVGVDFSRSAIRAARQKAVQHKVNVDLRKEDVTQLKGISGPFDLILEKGCFHSLPPSKPQPYLTIVNRLLAAIGVYRLYSLTTSCILY